MTTKKSVVVRVISRHMSGVRRRCGYTFGHKPSHVLVTKKELAEIKNDEFLALVTKGLALEDGKKNVNETKNGAELPPEDGEEKPALELTGDGEKELPTEDGEAEPPALELPTEDGEASKKPTLSTLMLNNKDKLEELAKSAGAIQDKDFTIESTKKELAELIISLNNQQ